MVQLEETRSAGGGGTGDPRRRTGGACRAPFSGGGGGRDTSQFLPWVGPGARDREAAPGSERAPGAGFRVCFGLAMGGAARTQRFSLGGAVPARGAPTGDGRAGETQRRGHLKKGGPRQGETQRDRQVESGAETRNQQRQGHPTPGS